MRTFLHKMCSLLLFVGVVAALPNFSLAQEAEQAPARENDKVDVVLLLDNSGSMRLTDPARLRDQGVKLLIQLLQPSDRLAIVEFAEDAKVLRPLSDYDPAQLENISQLISGMDSSGIYTDLLTAVKRSQDLFDRQGRPEARHVVVLLSDGKMEPDPKNGTPDQFTSQLLGEVLPTFKSNGTKVYTLSLSELADRELLGQIAAATEAATWNAPTAESIHKSYSDLFLTVKKPQVVSLTRKGFPIDAGVQEATFYITKTKDAQVTIVSPLGETIEPTTVRRDVKWFVGESFDVVTLKEPEAGDWRIDGMTSQESYATLLTNLKLVTEWPEGKILAGDKVELTAKLFESSKPIVLPEMTSTIQFAYQVTPTDRVSEPILRGVLADDGKDGDQREKDGTFSVGIAVDEEGEYHLSVVAKGPTFVRQQQIPFRVKPRIIKVSIITVEDPNAAMHGAHESGTKEYFRIQLSPDTLAFKKGKIKLIAVDADRHRKILPVTPSQDNQLFMDTPVTYLARDGEYEIYATFTAESKKKQEYVATSNLIEYTYKKPEEVKETPAPEEVIVVEEKKEEPEAPPNPIPWVILVTILNGGLGFAAMTFFKKQAGTVKSVELEAFKPSVELAAKIDQVEKLVDLVDVDLDDPMFAEEAKAAEAAADKPASTETQAATSEVAAESTEATPPSEEEAKAE